MIYVFYTFDCLIGVGWKEGHLHGIEKKNLANETLDAE